MQKNRDKCRLIPNCCSWAHKTHKKEIPRPTETVSITSMPLHYIPRPLFEDNVVTALWPGLIPVWSIRKSQKILAMWRANMARNTILLVFIKLCHGACKPIEIGYPISNYAILFALLGIWRVLLFNNMVQCTEGYKRKKMLTRCSRQPVFAQLWTA